MNISTLQEHIISILQQRSVEHSVLSLGVIEITENASQRRIHLYNLLREIQIFPTRYQSMMELFVTRCLESTSMGEIFPRLISYNNQKPLYHPWVENIIPTILDVSLIQHSKGVLSFISPMDIVQSSQSLAIIKKSAVVNLLPLLDMVSIQSVDHNVWRFSHPEILTSSLLLILCRSSSGIQRIVSSMKFASVPNRSTLWIGGEELNLMKQSIISDWKQLPHPIRPDIFPWTMQSSKDWVQSWS